jgi:hypothetical protein
LPGWRRRKKGERRERERERETERERERGVGEWAGIVYTSFHATRSSSSTKDS